MEVEKRMISRGSRDYAGPLPSQGQPYTAAKLDGVVSRMTSLRRSIDAQANQDGRENARSPENNAGITRDRVESIAAGLLLAHRRRSRRGTASSESSGLITQAPGLVARHPSSGVLTDTLTDFSDKRTSRASQLKSMKEQYRVINT